MPRINGFELFGKIFAIDFNVRVCLISSGEINWEALRKYIQHGEKDVVLESRSIYYLLKRIRPELD